MFITTIGGIASAVGAVGGLLGGGSSTQQTAQLDPRMAKLLYGDGTEGSTGLLGQAQNWYDANKTGLNSEMLRGLNQQNAVYSSPMAQQGYERMAQQGYGLMGQGVAQNPFTSGNMPQFGNWGARQQAQAGPQQTQQAAQPQQLASTQQQASTMPALNNGLLGLGSGTPAFAAPAPTPAPVRAASTGGMPQTPDELEQWLQRRNPAGNQFA